MIENTTIKIRIILLDPKSEAANRRAEIEKDGSTIDDINYTIKHGIKSAVKRRIDNKIRNTPEIRELLDTYKGLNPTEKKKMDINQNLLESVNLELKLYKIDPIVFIMGFQECLFAEQYHFGRPEIFVIPGSCIGKHVPVIQYRKNCKGYAFFKSHFDFMWKNGEDITMKVIQSSLESYVT